jgi:hypothetical protein
MVKKVEEPKSFDWKSLYLYAVSLITLLICLFAVISMIRSGVDAAFPDYGYIDPYAQNNGVKVDQELIKQANIDQNRRNAAKNIVGSAATLLVTVPLYLYHWRLVRK